MAQAGPAREIEFEAVFSFRDLGGYGTRDGRRVAWRRVFRSGELRHATPNDVRKLRGEVGLRSVLDLRDEAQISRHGLGPAPGGFGYRNVSLSADEGSSFGGVERLHGLTNTGQIYLLMMKSDGYGRRLVACFRFISEAGNHPLVFHCSAGKDRTGVLAACLLSVLGVGERDIVEDYTLSGPHMAKHIERISRNPEDAKFLQSLPAWMHEASARSMELFLSTMRQDYGSVRDYLLSHGAEPSLFERLEGALLV